MFNDQNIKPMLIKEVVKPFNDNNYFYELKFDGYRAIIYASRKNITIKSRNGHDITKDYPKLASIKELLKNEKVIFDGEIVYFEKGKPSFSKLKTNDNEDMIVFIVFDILYKNKSLINLKLEERKKILDQYPNTEFFFKSKIYNNGLTLFKQVKKLGLEGIIAKEKNSKYLPGKRVDTWLKIKNYQQSTFLVHSIIFNKEKYSLILGEMMNNKLYFVGKVSTIDKNLINDFLKTPVSKNKFVNYNEKLKYIKPLNKVIVKYINRTPDNKLREPVLIKKA